MKNNRDSAPKQAETTNKSKRVYFGREKLLARANGVDRQRLSI